MPTSPRVTESLEIINNSNTLNTTIKSLLRVAESPVDPGSVSASTFSLIIICLGAGTLGIPYVYYSNGFILGTFDIVFGGAISLFSGHLIAHCAEET